MRSFHAKKSRLEDQPSPVVSYNSRCLTHLLMLACGLLLMNGSVQGESRDPFADERNRMVDEDMVAEGITDQRILDSMRQVPRHLFVGIELRKYAYYDQALNIGYKQTISPPSIVGYMTQMLDTKPEDRVLEIGTGSGYQAAVLSPLVKDVYTIEIVEPLGKKTGLLLKRLKYPNIHTRIGDGYLGWEEEAPFDKIIVTCSPEKIPEPLVAQLKEGGKMIIPLGERYQQVFYLLEKRDGKLIETKLIPTLFVPMTGRSEELREVLPDPAKPEVINGGFEEATLQEGKADAWYFQRRTALVSEGAAEGKQFLRFSNPESGRPSHILQGLPMDGSKVRSLDFSLKLKVSDIQVGSQAYERPQFVVHFYDSRRVPVETATIGPWIDDIPDWTSIQKTISVPEQAREAIIQVGLNGASGTLDLDDIRMTPRSR
ncbi:MAG: protein-L-isoaspartate(D-aspartate) O-methyltransferase [Planctomycetaceae bacterium]